jgi:hypothetical protein
MENQGLLITNEAGLSGAKVSHVVSSNIIKTMSNICSIINTENNVSNLAIAELVCWFSVNLKLGSVNILNFNRTCTKPDCT